MVGATTGLTAAWLAPDAAHEVFGAHDAVACGVFAPSGRARREGDHYRISGRWSFASGCDHASWRMVGAIDEESGRVMSALLRAEQTEIVRNWDVVGLRGTGSHDLTARHALVPATHTLSLFDRSRRNEVLYRLPPFGVLAVGVAAVSLGLARAALDRFVALAHEKVPAGARRTLSQRESVQLTLAQTEARLMAARALLDRTIADTTTRVAADGNPSLEVRASLRLAACHAAREAVAVVDALFAMAGAGAVRTAEPLQRLWRDVHVASQHAMVADAVAVLAGRVRLGIETDGAQV
jgi:alkylation response protein AidB-like acyl-CoA dehydrogenase